VTPALQGVRVSDVSTVLAAPVAATMLGDFGAEVVKMEQPTVGDMTRRRAKQPGGPRATAGTEKYDPRPRPCVTPEFRSAIHLRSEATRYAAQRRQSNTWPPIQVPPSRRIDRC